MVGALGCIGSGDVTERRLLPFPRLTAPSSALPRSTDATRSVGAFSRRSADRRITGSCSTARAGRAQAGTG